MDFRNVNKQGEGVQGPRDLEVTGANAEVSDTASADRKQTIIFQDEPYPGVSAAAEEVRLFAGEVCRRWKGGNGDLKQAFAFYEAIFNWADHTLLLITEHEDWEEDPAYPAEPSPVEDRTTDSESGSENERTRGASNDTPVGLNTQEVSQESADDEGVEG